MNEMSTLVSLILVLFDTAEDVVESSGEGCIGAFSFDDGVEYAVFIYKSESSDGYVLKFDDGTSVHPVESVLAAGDAIHDGIESWLIELVAGDTL